MKKATAFLLAAGSFLLGAVAGFVFSPVKKGVYIAGGIISFGGEEKPALYKEK